MTRSEKKLWTIVTVAVLGITSLPYVYAFLSEPPDRQFMGILLNVPDYGQYLSWFREFKYSILIENKLTPEPNNPVFFNLLWWTLAKISLISGMSFNATHQVFRIVAGAMCLGALYTFLLMVLPRPRVRITAFLLAVFGAGFGWVLVLIKHTLTGGDLIFPLDVYIAEPNTFLCIMAFPHFTAANALIVMVFGLHMLGYKRQQLRYAVAAGTVGFVLAFQHAYDILILYSVLGAFTVLITLRDRKIPWFLVKSNFWVGLISFSPGLYSVWLTQANPIWQKVLAQFSNAGVYTPDPFHLLILMGLPLLLAIVTFDGILTMENDSDEMLFVKGWFVVGFFLLYIPTDFQVHMLNSWQISVAIIAANGLFRFIIPMLLEHKNNILPAWSPQKIVRNAIIGIVSLAALTNLYLLAWRFVDLGRHDYPYFLHREEVAALQWLDEHTNPAAVVLSSYTIGHFIPSISGNKAFLAHWAQTIDFYEKRDRTTHFFSSRAAHEERLATTRKFNVDYIFYGPLENRLGNFNPAGTPWLTPAFSSPQVTIYRVEHGKLKNS